MNLVTVPVIDDMCMLKQCRFARTFVFIYFFENKVI